VRLRAVDGLYQSEEILIRLMPSIRLAYSHEEGGVGGLIDLGPVKDADTRVR
jgi:hypothetical protein